MQAKRLEEVAPRPRISLSGARAAYIGPGLNLSPHRNATATIAVALRKPFELALLDARPGEGFATVGIALIPPGALHHLRASGEIAFIYLDALGDDHGRMVTTDLAEAQARLAGEQAGSVRAWDVDALCGALGVPARDAADARIAAAVRRIDERPQDFGRVADAAAVAGLSPSRFQALFRRSVGTPFRRYRLWRRMALVVRAVSAGRTLTAASLDAGFSSSAHLSATFRTMFGLTPSDLATLGARVELTDQALAAQTHATQAT